MFNVPPLKFVYHVLKNEKHNGVLRRVIVNIGSRLCKAQLSYSRTASTLLHNKAKKNATVQVTDYGKMHFTYIHQ